MNKSLLLIAAFFAAYSSAESYKNTLPEAAADTTSKSHKNTLAETREKVLSSQAPAGKDKAPATMAAPQVKDLALAPDFDPALFQVDAKTYLNELEFTPAEKEERYYFHGIDQDHSNSEQAQGGGYYRQILGKTASGDIVAQDFYQDINAPQTAPFLLMPNKEKDFSTESSNGRTVWFNPEGQVEMIADFAQGKRLGWSLILRDGKPIMRIRSLAENEESTEHLIFSEAGKPLVHNKDGKEHTFFYPNGSAMFYVDERKTPIQFFAWTEDGEPLDPEIVKPQIMPLLIRQDDVINYVIENGENY